MTEPRKTERFSRIPIYSGLSPEERAQIQAISREQSVPTGTDIVKPGEPGDAFYIILEGQVDVRLPKEGEVSVVIAKLSTLSVFGEMSFLGKRKRSAFVTTTKDTRLRRIAGEDFWKLIQIGDLAAYKVIANFAKLIAERLSRVEKELLEALDKQEPETRREKLAELQQFRNKLFEEWSF